MSVKEILKIYICCNHYAQIMRMREIVKLDQRLCNLYIQAFLGRSPMSKFILKDTRFRYLHSQICDKCPYQGGCNLYKNAYVINQEALNERPQNRLELPIVFHVNAEGTQKTSMGFCSPVLFDSRVSAQSRCRFDRWDYYTLMIDIGMSKFLERVPLYHKMGAYKALARPTYIYILNMTQTLGTSWTLAWAILRWFDILKTFDICGSENFDDVLAESIAATGTVMCYEDNNNWLSSLSIIPIASLEEKILTVFWNRPWIRKILIPFNDSDPECELLQRKLCELLNVRNHFSSPLDVTSDRFNLNGDTRSTLILHFSDDPQTALTIVPVKNLFEICLTPGLVFQRDIVDRSSTLFNLFG